MGKPALCSDLYFLCPLRHSNTRRRVIHITAFRHQRSDFLAVISTIQPAVAESPKPPRTAKPHPTLRSHVLHHGKRACRVQPLKRRPGNDSEVPVIFDLKRALQAADRVSTSLDNRGIKKDQIDPERHVIGEGIPILHPIDFGESNLGGSEYVSVRLIVQVQPRGIFALLDSLIRSAARIERVVILAPFNSRPLQKSSTVREISNHPQLLHFGFRQALLTSWHDDTYC
jgi:hypothetical protein